MHSVIKVYTLILLMGCVGPLDLAQLMCQGQGNLCVCLGGWDRDPGAAGSRSCCSRLAGWYYRLSTICLYVGAHFFFSV